MVVFVFFIENSMKNVHDSLDGVIQEDVAVVVCNQLIADNDQL